MPDAADYRLIFRQTPELLLILSRDFTMLDATEARLTATLTTRDETIGRNLFEVFPDNPLDPAPTGSRNLRASLEHVLATGRPDAMAVQKYDIPASDKAGEPFEERYWSPLNVPVLGEDGRVRYILHRVQDVTDFVRLRLGVDVSAPATAPPLTPGDPQERDLILRAREVQAANQLLRESNETMRALRQEAEFHRGRLEALLLSVTDGFLLLDRGFRIQYLNPPEARLLGAPPERLLDAVLWDVLPADVRSASAPFLRQVMDERRPVVFEYHDASKNRWFEKRACPAPDGIAVLTVDVTERTLAQKLDAAKYAVTRALAASPRLADAGETFLHHLCAAVDAQVGCFWQKSLDGEFLELAHAYADESLPGRFDEFLALSRSRRHPPGGSLPGRVWIARKVTWIPALAADAEFTRGPAATTAGLVGGIGVPVSIDDDLVGVIELFLPRRPAPAEAALRALGAVGSEISQFIRRRRAEAEQTRLSAIVHSSHDAIVGISIERLVTSWNRGAESLYGHPAAEMLGRNITRIVPPERLPEFEDLFARVLHGERIDPLDTVRLRKDGSRIDVSLSWSPIRDDDGSIVGISAIARDITAHRRAELVERRNRELQEENRRALEANRLKSDFLASMSHELRTPLHGVIGFSEFLVDEKVGPLNATQKEFLNDVLNSGRHLLRLINNILDLSKIEAGRLELFPERLRLDDLIHEVCAILRPLAEQHQVALRFEPDTARFEVFLDPLRLRQILYNLLANAVQYNRPGGRAELEILRLPGPPDRLQFAVSDDGPGIRPEDRARIFEEFRQLGAPRSQSTGLGLAVTRRLVECMQGDITVESEPGRGSRFTVSIPLSAAPTPPEASP